jgi:diaminohydroxyphosphoribosylaminopyrimidine deaminase / 5-amino-6-(5-phosphoribosylamino)uracil reductase
MPPQPSSASSVNDAQLQASAWRALLAAAAWARALPADPAGAARREGPRAFELDEPSGTLRPAEPAAASAWLAWDGSAGWNVAAGAPEAVRSLLELYLPFCAAGALGPLTLAHLGQSLDGWIATGSGDSYYVTGPDNVVHLHRLRALCDAVIVRAGTVARDDPQLTVRHVEGGHPVRVILDPRRRLGPEHRVFTTNEARTLLVCAEENAREARHGAAEVIGVPLDDGKLRLDLVLEGLHARGLPFVFVEGGGATVSSFLEAGLLDRLHVAIAPLVTGRGRRGLSLPARDKIEDCLRPRHRVFAMGGDVLFDCDLRAAASDRGAARGNLTQVL